MLLGQTPFPAIVSPFAPTGAALLLLLAAGGLLWAFGGRLLRPGLALIGLIAGLPSGVWLGGAVAPEVPPFVFAAAGALAGLVLACVSYRLALGAVTAILVGVLALMAAWSAADMGLVDAGAAANRIDAASAELRRAQPLPEELATLTRLLLGVRETPVAGRSATTDSPGRPAPAAAPEPGQAADPTTDQAPSAPIHGALPGLVDRLRAAIEHRWTLMPQPMRTLLWASLAAGVLVGFLFGLLCAEAAARVVTSLAGSLLLLVCGIPLLSALLGRADDLLPPRPAAWFVAVALLAIIGYGVQRTTAVPRSPEPQRG